MLSDPPRSVRPLLPQASPRLAALHITVVRNLLWSIQSLAAAHRSSERPLEWLVNEDFDLLSGAIQFITTFTGSLQEKEARNGGQTF
jgi:hypothetical protein